MSDEEDINIMKNTNIAYSDSLSALNENASTYMGVKTIPEGTIPDTNQDNKYKKSKKSRNKAQKRPKKKNKKKYEKLDYSYSYSSSHYSSSISSSSSYSYSESIKSSKKKESLKDKTKNIEDKKVKKLKKNKNKKNKRKESEENEENEENEEKEENEEDSKYELNIEEIQETKIKKDENELINTKFEWDEGGNIVYLTGSFCDWNKFHLMTKNDEGKYTITIPLPRGFHQYKFKVDDIWTYSKKQPKFEDNGNVNNFIDTTDYHEYYLNEEEMEINKDPFLSKENKHKEKSKKKTKDEINNIKKEKNKDNANKNKSNKSNIKVKKVTPKKKDKRNSSSHDTHFLNQNQYSIYYPLRAEFSKRPSALPGLFKTYYILNEKKNQKKSQRKFSQIEYIDDTNNSIQDNKIESQTQSLNNTSILAKDIDPYVNFQNLYHIHSNHFHSKNVSQKQNTITSIISRYRFKFSTFIYYKENKPLKEVIKKMHSKTVRLKKAKKEKKKNVSE